MKRSSLAATLGIAILAAAPTAAATTDVVGSSGQLSDQSINSTQQGRNAVAAPNQVIVGGAKNKFNQNSANTAVSAQGVGVAPSPGGDKLVASPGGPGFTQQSSQDVNSAQTGGRIQNSTNLLASIQIVGEGLFGGGPTDIIANVKQGNRQAANSSQIGATSGMRIQNSANTLVNVQIVSARVLIGQADQTSSQGINSSQQIPSGKKMTGTVIVATGLPLVNFPGFIIGTPTGPVTQNSDNTTVNAQLILP